MAVTPIYSARISDGFKRDAVLSAIRRTNAQLAQVQNQLATGVRLDRPSVDPAAAANTLQLQAQLERRRQYLQNINHALGALSTADAATGEMSGLLLDAKTLAAENIGVTSNTDQRAAAAILVDGIIDQIISLGNTQFGDIFIFGGRATTEAPFMGEGGGVRYLGDTVGLTARVDAVHNSDYTLPGSQLFGALSSEVKGRADLTPALIDDTRIEELRGRSGNGVTAGPISITDGVTTHTVDLSGAATVGEIVDRITNQTSAAISATIDPASPTGITISSSAGGADITITEIGAGKTAAELGILTGSAGASFIGNSPEPRLSNRTPLAALLGGAGIDVASGLRIDNGAAGATIDTGALSTVGDLLGAINGAGLGVQASLNAAGDGIDVINTISGVPLSIGENGGLTATDLGIRSFDGAVPLAALNDGRGVATVSGDDVRLWLHDGSSIDVDLSSAVTVGEVVSLINAAGGGAVTADFNPVGNGIRLTDNTAGVADFSVAALNGSTAAGDLGIVASAAAPTNEINGSDVNPINADGVLGHLIALRDALLNNDDREITAAAEKLDADHADVVRQRSELGVKVQALESRRDRTEDAILESEILVSQLKDVDFTEAIIRFQSLQSALQATLITSGASLQNSLLDFLR